MSWELFIAALNLAAASNAVAHGGYGMGTLNFGTFLLCLGRHLTDLLQQKLQK